MKSYTNLHSKICSDENLYLAAKKAEKGKRFRDDVGRFNLRRAENLLKIQSELRNESYVFGKYRTHRITEPKPRTISAAPYRDRVVHHAIINVIGPLFERQFIHDSCANRKGRGTSAALSRCTQFARRYRYFAQIDIQKYFPSIDFELLEEELQKTVRCRPTQRLLSKLLHASNPQEPANYYFPGDSLFTPFDRSRGLPIGNLTSQYFANIYLNRFDHYVKERMRVGGYIRYVDDMLMFNDDAKHLWQLIERSKTFLATWRLRINPAKYRVAAVGRGIPFLGFIVFPSHRRLQSGAVKRFRRRMRDHQICYANGSTSLDRIRDSMFAWNGHAAQGDTWEVRTKLFREFVFKRAHPREEKSKD